MTNIFYKSYSSIKIVKILHLYVKKNKLTPEIIPYIVSLSICRPAQT